MRLSRAMTQVVETAESIASDPDQTAQSALEYARYALRWRLVSPGCLARARSVRYLAECRRKVLDASA